MSRVQQYNFENYLKNKEKYLLEINYTGANKRKVV